jgi:hypothetical protein
VYELSLVAWKLNVVFRVLARSGTSNVEPCETAASWRTYTNSSASATSARNDSSGGSIRSPR